MELLKSLGIDWHVLIAQAVNFLILLYLLKRFLYQPVLQMLDARKERIAKAMAAAKESEVHVTQTATLTAEMIAQAKKNAAEILEEVQKEADSLRVKLATEAEKEIALAKVRALEEINAEKIAFSASLRDQVAKLTLLVLTRVLKTDMREEYAKKSIEQAMAEVLR